MVIIKGKKATPGPHHAVSTARRRNEAACPHPYRRFPITIAPSPTSAENRNPHSHDEIRFAIADLAAESSVEHLVYSSGASVGEKATGVARFDAKPRIEAHIRSLPVTATIIRPMIFMEMLAKPGFGLDEGRFTFFLRPDQPMQLIAVDDIGKFVAAIFADEMRFAGKTLKIASDTVTGSELGAIFTEAVGRPIAYARFADEVLAANTNLGQLAASLDDGPLAGHVDLDAMRAINPQIVSFRSWLAGSGRKALEEALGPSGGVGDPHLR